MHVFIELAFNGLSMSVVGPQSVYCKIQMPCQGCQGKSQVYVKKLSTLISMYKT